MRRRRSGGSLHGMSFNPYLMFSGDCAEAFRFYGSVFGVEPRVMTNADTPPGEEGMTGAPADAVMHASIELNGSFLMGSDDPSGDGGPKVGFAVSYSASDPADARRTDRLHPSRAINRGDHRPEPQLQRPLARALRKSAPVCRCCTE